MTTPIIYDMPATTLAPHHGAFPAHAEVDTQLIYGPSGAGKTRFLADEAHRLLVRGTDPSSILIVCPSPAHAWHIASLVDETLRDRVTDVRSLVLKVLGLPQAVTVFGCNVRLMDAAEQAIYEEDMKTTGERKRRIFDMLGYFERRYSDMTEVEDDFPSGDEERDMMAYENDYLRMRKAMTPAIAASAAARLIEKYPEIRDQLGIDCVMAAEFQLMSRASQAVCVQLARHSFIATLDHDSTFPLSDKYPSRATKAEFLRDFPATQVCEMLYTYLPTDVCAALDVLRQDEGMATSPLTSISTDAGIARRIEAGTPTQELATVAGLVQEILATGILPERIAITAASPVWLSNLRRYLRHAGIPISQAPRQELLKVSRKSPKRNGAPRVTTMLRLAADPTDPCAWRTWVGLGSYTANSGAFIEIRKVFRQENLSIPEILEQIDAGQRPQLSEHYEMADVMAEYHRGLEILGQLEGLTGPALVDALCTLAPTGDKSPAREVAELLGPVDEGASAAQLAAQLDDRRLRPAFEPDAVRLGLPEELAGYDFDVVIVAGAVNGFVPRMEYFDLAATEPDERARERSSCARRLYSIMSRASKQLYVTHFSTLPLEQAEMMKLEVHRVFFAEGNRMAKVKPSVLIEGIQE